MNIRRSISAGMLALALAVTGATVAQAKDAGNPHSLSAICKHEDSNNCHWNAQKQGNGKGLSFYDIPPHSRAVVTSANGKKRIISLKKGTIVYDRKNTRSDGYMRQSTVTTGWVMVCPRGWAMEMLNDWQYACN